MKKQRNVARTKLDERVKKLAADIIRQCKADRNPIPATVAAQLARLEIKYNRPL